MVPFGFGFWKKGDISHMLIFVGIVVRV